MALRGRHNLWRRGNLFILLFIFLWFVVVGFTTFSFVRERSFKVQYINNSLLQLNKTIARDYAAGQNMNEVFVENSTYYPSLRLTLLSLDGEPIFDSNPLAVNVNHAERPEVRIALEQGSGFTVRRVSESTSETYFYSALVSDDIIVRSALPYSTYLEKSLRFDYSFIWYVLAVTVIISALSIVAYRKIKRDEQEIELQHERALFEQSEKIRIKRQLTNNINHELKTPVCVIKASLETVVANPDMADSQRENFIEKSLAQTERLEKLLQDVATITRLDEAPEMFSKSTIALRDVIEDAVEELQLKQGRLPIRINLQLPADNAMAMQGNYDSLKSLFRNLLDNAFAYSGGRDIFIIYRGKEQRPEGEFYLLSFYDNGIGVEPEHLKSLFDRFYRVDAGRSRRLGGTGLGLSIVRNAVALHGGTIEAKNRKEGGLQFDFSLRV